MINSSKSDFKQQLKAACSETNCKLAFDAIGGESPGSYHSTQSTTHLTSPEVLAQCLSPGATIYIYGALSGKSAIVPIGPLVGAGLTVTGLFLTAEIMKLDRADMGSWIQTAAKGLKGSLATTIRKSFPLSQIVNAVLESQTHATQGKTLVGNI